MGGESVNHEGGLVWFEKGRNPGQQFSADSRKITACLSYTLRRERKVARDDPLLRKTAGRKTFKGWTTRTTHKEEEDSTKNSRLNSRLHHQKTLRMIRKNKGRKKALSGSKTGNETKGKKKGASIRHGSHVDRPVGTFDQRTRGSGRSYLIQKLLMRGEKNKGRGGDPIDSFRPDWQLPEKWMFYCTVSKIKLVEIGQGLEAVRAEKETEREVVLKKLQIMPKSLQKKSRAYNPTPQLSNQEVKRDHNNNYDYKERYKKGGQGNELLLRSYGVNSSIKCFGMEIARTWWGERWRLN